MNPPSDQPPPPAGFHRNARLASIGTGGWLASESVAGFVGMRTLMSGGIAITRGGYNDNIARGKLSAADQAVTTLSGVASGHGVAKTYGGYNTNKALGKFSYAGQDVTTV